MLENKKIFEKYLLILKIIVQQTLKPTISPNHEMEVTVWTGVAAVDGRQLCVTVLEISQNNYLNKKELIYHVFKTD